MFESRRQKEFWTLSMNYYGFLLYSIFFPIDVCSFSDCAAHNKSLIALNSQPKKNVVFVLTFVAFICNVHVGTSYMFDALNRQIDRERETLAFCFKCRLQCDFLFTICSSFRNVRNPCGRTPNSCRFIANETMVHFSDTLHLHLTRSWAAHEQWW